MKDPLMFDTLRVADKLADNGFERPQAEGLARVLGDELANRAVSQQQLDMVVGDLRGEFAALATKFDKLEARMEGGFKALEGELKAIHTKFWFLYSALGLLLALGLVEVLA